MPVEAPELSTGEVKINVINYNKDDISERVVESVEECLKDAEDPTSVTWVNIEALSDSQVIKEVGETFGIHVLWLEDVLNTDHRPKLEELDDLIFCIIKAVDYGQRKKGHITFEQVSLFLGDHFVISFQELPGDVFKDVLTRLHKRKGQIRTAKADYLFYAIIDSVVDEYYAVLEKMGAEIESIEIKVFEDFHTEIYKDISRLRNELIYLRKSAVPIRDVLSQCVRTSRREVNERTKKYFKDAHDHIIQAVDIIESYFQMLDSARDAFNSVQANKMNEVMKVLTIFASIFIPLTFVAGVYGMNFENMPELKWEYGYAYSWVVMILVGFSLVGYFKYKKWL